MCYELKKPYSLEKRAAFVMEYNNSRGLKIEDTEMYLFALEPNEIMGTKEIEIEVPDEVEEGEEQTYHTETITIPYPVINPDYEEEQAALREANFKSQFFNIPNYGWFRKVPKGYSSAVESLNTAFNAVTLLQKLPENMLIFYAEPDYTKPEECTEEWLVEHQTFNEEMTVQEFGQFYMVFMQAWNTQEHVTEG